MKLNQSFMKLVEVILDNHPSIIVACIYKHPNMDIDEFNILYSNLLDKINSENKQALLMGDFNIDLLKADLKPSHNDFLETNLSRFFTPQITRPTRITPYSKTLIDNIFTNILSFESNSHNLICGISDHLPQILNLDISANKRTKTKKSWRDFSKFDREDFLLDFISISWPDQFENKTTNQKLETFINLTNNLVDQHAPIKTKFINDFISPKPWVTFGLRQAMLNRDKYHSEYLKLKDDSPEKIPKFARYKRHRNFIIKLLRISKNKYIKEYFFRHKTNLSLIWKTINEITNTKTKDNSTPKLLIHNNTHVTKEEDIAELFNDFYGSIAEKTKAKIPPTNKVFTDFMGNPTNASIHLTPTTPMAVYKLIEKIDLKKASGPNSIDPKILKMTSITASEIISYIFNECLDKGEYPDCLKKANIKPLHKKNARTEVSNYRPISLLSNINKIFETLLHSRLVEFFEKQSVIFKNQFGFRKGHSTSHAITALTEIVRSSLDKTEFSAAVFLDFQKAFDTVDHNILLQKLSHYGVRGVALKVFESYLKNRSQCVVINDAQSNYHEVKHGVPQGSVLGPLMFIIYINDLHNSVCYSTSIHFADDTSLVFTEKSLKELNRKVNRDLALLVHWLRANKISLNASKTEIILFRTIRTKITKQTSD